MSELRKTKANRPKRKKPKTPEHRLGKTRPKKTPKKSRTRKRIHSPLHTLNENDIRLRNRDLERLQRAMILSAIPVSVLMKLNLTPMLASLMALMRAIDETLPGRVALNAPWVTPVEAQRIMEELEYIPEDSATSKQKIIQGLKLLHASGYLEHVPMINHAKAKPYKVIRGALDKFFA